MLLRTPDAKSLAKAEGILKKKGKDKKNKSLVTVHNCGKPLRRSLSFSDAVDVRQIEAENPAPGPSKVPKGKAMSQEEADKILAAVPAHISGF